jgi:hypothetical protein
MEEWFHDARPKEEVRRARPAVWMVMEDIQWYFPRSEDSHGYRIPKMHGLAKMIDYMTLFGSAINFYGGPGEASHKNFVNKQRVNTIMLWQ